VTPDEAKAFVKRYSFGYPLKEWGAELYAETRVPQVRLLIHLVLRAPHRDTGELGVCVYTEGIDSAALEYGGPPLLQHVIHGLCRHAVLHELDESLLFDGIRARDPHASRKPHANPARTSPDVSTPV
jgi:hypothetical protein